MLSALVCSLRLEAHGRCRADLVVAGAGLWDLLYRNTTINDGALRLSATLNGYSRFALTPSLLCNCLCSLLFLCRSSPVVWKLASALLDDELSGIIAIRPSVSRFARALLICHLRTCSGHREEAAHFRDSSVVALNARMANLLSSHTVRSLILTLDCFAHSS